MIGNRKNAEQLQRLSTETRAQRNHRTTTAAGFRVGRRRARLSERWRAGRSGAGACRVVVSVQRHRPAHLFQCGRRMAEA